jgi:hypothetical protein
MADVPQHMNQQIYSTPTHLPFQDAKLQCSLRRFKFDLTKGLRESEARGGPLQL